MQVCLRENSVNKTHNVKHDRKNLVYCGLIFFLQLVKIHKKYNLHKFVVAFIKDMIYKAQNKFSRILKHTFPYSRDFLDGSSCLKSSFINLMWF